MKSVSFLFLGVGLALLGFFGYAALQSPSAAQRQARTQWEYATIVAAYSFQPTRERTNKITGIAEICYLQATGCRLAEIKHELDYTAYLQERALPVVDSANTRNAAGIRASEIAFQKALVQMGSEGWELIGEPQMNFEFVDYENYLKFEDKSVFFNRTNTKAVYFKRLKTQ